MAKIIGWILISCWIVYDIILWQWAYVITRIAKDPISGSGYALGNMLFLILGIWLVCRKDKKVESNKE